MELEGKIKRILPTQQVSEKFSKREFDIETSGEYPQVNRLQCTQDKCALLDKFQPGQNVKVFINLRGREWEKEGKISVFNTLEAWKIEPIGTVQASPVENVGSGGDDLPF